MSNNHFHSFSEKARPIPNLKGNASAPNPKRSQADYMPVSSNKASSDPVTEPTQEKGKVKITKGIWIDPESIELGVEKGANIEGSIEILEKTQKKRLFIQAYSQVKGGKAQYASQPEMELFLKPTDGSLDFWLQYNEDLPHPTKNEGEQAEYWFTAEHWDGTEVFTSQKILLPNFLKPIHYTEISCFHLGSAIPLLEQSKNLEISLSAIQAYYQNNPSAKVALLGHADTSGEIDLNYTIGQERAQALYAILLNEQELWKTLTSSRSTLKDYQQILKTLTEYYGWNCDPGVVDGKSGKNTKAGLKAFQEQANEKLDLSLSPDGIIGPNTWTGLLTAIRSVALPNGSLSLPFRSDLDDGVFSCGESFPKSANKQDGLANAHNRRVEIVFCEEEPKLVPKQGKVLTATECRYYSSMGRWHYLEGGVAEQQITVNVNFWDYQDIHFKDTENNLIFSSKIKSLFGDDIPKSAINMLQIAIIEKKFPFPQISIVEQNDESIKGYYSKNQIYINKNIIPTDSTNQEMNWNLYMVLIEEIGHHIDYLLRNKYSSIEGDAYDDEGSLFLQEFIFSNKILDKNFTFAKIDYPEKNFDLSLKTNTVLRNNRAKDLLFMEDTHLDSGIITDSNGSQINVEFFKIAGDGAIHEAITKSATELAGLKYNTELDEGCAWPDVPCEDTNSVETCYYKTWRNEHKKGTIAYRSHHGDLQYWHSMASNNEETNGEILEKIIIQTSSWYNLAIKDNTLFHIGKILHTIQDSYSKSHVVRNLQKNELGNKDSIIRFQNYEQQDAKKHGAADKGNDWKKIPGAIEARNSSKDILLLYKNKKPVSDLEKLLRTNIYPFAKGAKEQKAGRSQPQYKKDTE